MKSLPNIFLKIILISLFIVEISNAQKAAFGWNRARRCNGCPDWRCQDDSAVIHGYCCHCPGSESDNVPVPCYPDLRCPPRNSRRFWELCQDYDYMMNCCCTGP